VSRRSADQVFVVRTWLESPGDTRTMRGRIDHAASGRRRYFANFGDLCDFIAGTQTFAPPAEAAETDQDSESVDAPETVPD
jgi:hypothetical protein